MKKYTFIALFALLALFSTNDTQAQQIDNDKNNYVVLTKKIPQLQPIILTAEALKAEDGTNFGDFKIIICGKNIGDITNPKKMKDIIEKAENTGVQLIACGFSLNKFKVDQAKIPKKIKVVKKWHSVQFSTSEKRV
ncbi:sulfur reduction protein DsrE [Zunongwangia profunda]|jgi:intracellular sulfur oxidation DsrE/DsrF family protein|uniref:sulfur reduction protein DsrE n=1 Tax=Zunongwangia profunda TaxID=398743 RepID=UPI00293F084A|nr:sulfur reduction protein DsrE [Zunongwangia profunda]